MNGLRFHCVTAGKGEPGKPLVLLLHGFPQDWYCWRHQIPAIAAAGYSVVAPDQRGYGETEKPSRVRDYRLESLVADAKGIVEAFGASKVIVVGHDWGAAVAWAFAWTHPEMVEKLVVLNVPHPGKMAEALRTNLRQVRRSWYMFAFQLPWLPEWALTRRGAANVARMMRGMAHRKEAFSKEDLEHYKAAMLRPGAARSTVAWYRAALRRPLAGMRMGRTGKKGSTKVHAPTLVIWGEDDTALGKELTYGLDRWCKGPLRIEYVKDCSHWVVEERPEDVTRWILEFAGEPAAKAEPRT